MSAKQRGLGRGLGALIGGFQEEPESGAVTKLNSEEISIETKAGKGMPYVVVVLDDVVTELQS